MNDREVTPKDVSLVAPGQGMRIRLGDDGLQNSLANARRRARVDGGPHVGASSSTFAIPLVLGGAGSLMAT